jgi:hypothetical protein
MLATGHSMENSLRWMRRSIVIILILANLMTVILADAAATVTKEHFTTIQYSDSGIQAGIQASVARLSSLETGANTAR